MYREIPMEQCRQSDVILCDVGKLSFKAGATNIVGPVLSFLIGLFNEDWRKLSRKPWHVRLVKSGYGTTATILEALGPGVLDKPIDSIPLSKQRAYRWFDDLPNADRHDKWCKEHLGKKYDVLAYPWTAIQYLARAIWNHYIPRLLDDRYTCWELWAEYCEDFTKPMHSKRDCPMITDICRSLGLIVRGYSYKHKVLSVLAERSK